MLRKTFVMLLSGVLTLTAFGVRPARAQSAQDAELAARARADISRLGTGEKARVEVRLRDDTRLKGYVSAAGTDSFTLTNRETGASQTVAYADVSKVKKSGGGLSTRTWVILGAVAATLVVVGIIVKPALCDGGAQTRGIC